MCYKWLVLPSSGSCYSDGGLRVEFISQELEDTCCNTNVIGGVGQGCQIPNEVSHGIGLL